MLAGLFFIPYRESKAALTTAFKPFGGRILTKIECDCGVGAIIRAVGGSLGISQVVLGLASTALNSLPNPVLIIVGPPVGGSYMILPGTKIYREYKLDVGVWVLGLSIPEPLPCIKDVKLICVPVGAGFPVTIVGTSF